jgi:hypothetical protein
MNNHPYIQINLITIDEAKGKFALNDVALATLRSLEGDIKVVAVAGLQRTGKSFLLNQLVMGQGGKFEVGSTVQTCTKGINMIVKRSVTSAEPNIIFLDTEGFGSTDRSQGFDIKLFSLALLLSSYFIYNSRGVIDSSAIEDLSLVVQLTKHIHVKERGKGESDDGNLFTDYFPTFHWIVRDFALKLVDEDGNEIDSRQYMENALDSASEDDESKQAMLVSNMIRGFFSNRDCMTLVRPVTDEEKLQNLASEPFETLRGEFREQLKRLREIVMKNAKVKTLNGAILSGNNFASLAETYVKSINDGEVPTIASAFDRMIKEQCLQAKDKALVLYEKRVRRTTTLSSQESDEDEENEDNNQEDDKRKLLLLKSCRESLKGVKLPIESDLLARSHEIASKIANDSFHREVSSLDGPEIVRFATPPPFFFRMLSCTNSTTTNIGTRI